MKLPIVIISYKSIALLENCLSNLGNNREILIIENSDFPELKEKIEKKFQNCKVIINKNNDGYGKAANLGFQQLKSKYVFILEPDIIISNKQLVDIENEILNCDEDFALATPIFDDLIDFNNNNNFDSDLNSKDLRINNNENKTKIDLIKGCSLIINLEKFENKNVFDENFFFFYEDIDLCKRVKKMKENIFVFNKIKIFHEGAKGVSTNINENYNDFRNWNFFWSKYYYHKKHYGYNSALIKHVSKLIRFSFNCLRFYFFSKNQYRKNKYRFLGLLSAILDIKSSKSNEILNKKE